MLESPVARHGPGVARINVRTVAHEWTFERHGFIVVFALPATLLVATVYLYPILYAFWVSLHQTQFLQLRQFAGSANYLRLVQDPTVWRATVNSVIYMMGSVIVTVPLGLGLALMLNRPLPLMGAIRGILIVPWVISQAVAALLWTWLLEPSMGPVNRLVEVMGHPKVFFLADPVLAMFTVIVVNIWLSYPFPMILFLAALKGVPPELYEAVQLDGAGRWATFRHIVFPFLRPTMLSTVILVSLLYLNMVALIYIMTGGGPLSATETLAVQAFKRSFMEFRIGLGATLGTLILVLNAVFGVGYLRLLRQQDETIY
jgi:multiple sugar transport system permease protein